MQQSILFRRRQKKEKQMRKWNLHSGARAHYVKFHCFVSVFFRDFIFLVSFNLVPILFLWHMQCSIVCNVRHVQCQTYAACSLSINLRLCYFTWAGQRKRVQCYGRIFIRLNQSTNSTFTLCYLRRYVRCEKENSSKHNAMRCDGNGMGRLYTDCYNHCHRHCHYFVGWWFGDYYHFIWVFVNEFIFLSSSFFVSNHTFSHSNRNVYQMNCHNGIT